MNNHLQKLPCSSSTMSDSKELNPIFFLKLLFVYQTVAFFPAWHILLLTWPSRYCKPGFTFSRERPSTTICIRFFTLSYPSKAHELCLVYFIIKKFRSLESGESLRNDIPLTLIDFFPIEEKVHFMALQ